MKADQRWINVTELMQPGAGSLIAKVMQISRVTQDGVKLNPQ